MTVETLCIGCVIRRDDPSSNAVCTCCDLPVATAIATPAVCGLCGATETDDDSWWNGTKDGKPVFTKIRRLVSLEHDYCYGCGIVVCQACDSRKDPGGIIHEQADHRP